MTYRLVLHTISLALVVALFDAGIAGNAFHVAPDGMATGRGTARHPWNLITALSQPAEVRGGDTLWLHGGVYLGSFHSLLRGTEDTPIIVRSYPGERPILDNAGTRGAALHIEGSHTWFWGFEVRSSNPNPPREESGVDLGSCIGIKLINLIVHDEGSTAFTPYSASINAEIYGCLAYYNGREDDPAKRNGYGMYGQNIAPSRKNVLDGFFFNNFGIFQVHMTGSSVAKLDGMTFDGNTFFGHTLYDSKNVVALYGNYEPGSGKGRDPHWCSNFFYRADLWLGYNGDGVENATLTDNYFFRGALVENKGNTYASRSGNRLTSTDGQVFVRPNKYADWADPRRANIIVFNGRGDSAITVSLPDGVLRVGEMYFVHDVQNVLGTAVDSGTYRGGPLSIRIPGSRSAISKPISIPRYRPGTSLPAHTSDEFGAFILIVPVKPGHAVDNGHQNR